MPVTVYNSIMLLITHAQSAKTEINRILDLVQFLETPLRTLIALAAAVAILFFFWGVTDYVRKGGEAKGGKNAMLWGAVAVFVLVSTWGLVLHR